MVGFAQHLLTEPISPAKLRDDWTPPSTPIPLNGEDYQLLIENAVDIVFAVSLEGKILSLNPAFHTALGWDNDEWIGKHFLPLLHPDDVQNLYNVFLKASSGESIRYLSGRVLKKSGDYLVGETSAMPIIRRGEVVGVMGTLRDITRLRMVETETKELREIEEQMRRDKDELARSNRELEEFAAIASHDLQEPLRMVISYLQLLQRKFGTVLGSEGNEFIGYASDGALRMRQLIRDLLAYSRVGKDKFTCREINCESLLISVLENLKVSVQESGGKVTWRELPTVRGSALLLGQLFQNLISNSLKFRGSGVPSVEISAERGEKWWLFSVKDNGIGIPTADTERVFALFQRLHERRLYPGTGVGLAICKKIVDHHGGRIWFRSPPGGGTVFYFTLPVAEAAPGS